MAEEGYLIPQDLVTPFFATVDRERSRNFPAASKVDDVGLMKKHKSSAVVVLGGNLRSNETVPAIVMERLPGRNIIEVVPTGVVSPGRNEEFGVMIGQGSGPRAKSRTVFIPYNASAEEFHRLCGFTSDTRVCLGTLQTALFLRWRVMFPDDQTSLGPYTEPGQEPLTQCVCTKDQWFATNGMIGVNLYYPTPKAPDFAPTLSDARIEWNVAKERWEIIKDQPPVTGETFYMHWSSGQEKWFNQNPFSSAYWGGWGIGWIPYSRIVSTAVDGNDTYLVYGGSAVPNPPQFRDYTVAWFVWESGKWKYAPDSNTYRHYRMWNHGWYGWGDRYYNDRWGLSDGTPVIPVGSLCLVHHNGRDWIVGDYERYSFRFFVDPP